jgi:23S rRNA pseudouridine2604 synthase
MSERLNRYISAAGLCSRRDADRLIREGKVRINGAVAALGAVVEEADAVDVNGKRVQAAAEKIVLAFYKPVGVTCTEKDRFAKKMVKDVLRYPVRLTYAGRLDKDSEGLLLMTNDGSLIERMMRGENGHEKEYIVKVDKEITDGMAEKLKVGVWLPELALKTRPCQIKILGKYTFGVILTQGVNKQIRRMCEACGYRVKSLKRIRVINIELANLKAGEYRRIKNGELAELYQKCGM